MAGHKSALWERNEELTLVRGLEVRIRTQVGCLGSVQPLNGCEDDRQEETNTRRRT